MEQDGVEEEVGGVVELLALQPLLGEVVYDIHLLPVEHCLACNNKLLSGQNLQEKKNLGLEKMFLNNLKFAAQPSWKVSVSIFF